MTPLFATIFSQVAYKMQMNCILKFIQIRKESLGRVGRAAQSAGALRGATMRGPGTSLWPCGVLFPSL